jgi:hypothetical protein
MFPPKPLLVLTGLHGVSFQKVEILTSIIVFTYLGLSTEDM